MVKKPDKEKLFMVVLIFALIAIFMVVFIYGLDSVLAMEGSFPPNVLEEGLTPAPENKETAIEFLNTTIDGAILGKPKLEAVKHFDLNTETIETSGTEELKTMLGYAAADFDAQLDSNFESITTDFGEEIADKLNVPAITADDIAEFKCDYIYYQCPSCGEESDKKQPNCEICGGVYPYNMRYRDDYTVTLTVTATDKTLGGNFGKRTKQQALALCGDTLNDFADVRRLDIAYNELQIIFKIERLTNNLKSLEYTKLMKIDADVKMLGKYEKIGNINTAFEITEHDSYNFTWPGISLSENEITVEPKGTNNLLATLTCTDPLKETVKWESTDESIIEVDEEGYFDATDKIGEAKIIASFEFKGKIYTDECVIKVRNSVESSKMDKKKLELSVGASEQLSVTVLPKKATVKTVEWYSEDEKIATVDENGVVTAAAPGVVTVYSLTDDGYFKSSCEVTVK